MQPGAYVLGVEMDFDLGFTNNQKIQKNHQLLLANFVISQSQQNQRIRILPVLQFHVLF